MLPVGRCFAKKVLFSAVYDDWMKRAVARRRWKQRALLLLPCCCCVSAIICRGAARHGTIQYGTLYHPSIAPIQHQIMAMSPDEPTVILSTL